MSRLLGIDLGERRIGLAIGDTGLGVALPIATIARGKTVEADARTVGRIAAERHADRLVVGLPLDMDGSEGPQAQRTREWADEVAAATHLPVSFRDERLSSERASGRMPGSPPRGRSGGPPSSVQRDAYRGRIDREAAAIILQDELDWLRNAPRSDSPGPSAARGDAAGGDPEQQGAE